MTIPPIVPLVCAIVGALVYFIAKDGKASELGRIGFWVGLFWAVAHYAGKVSIG